MFHGGHDFPGRGAHANTSFPRPAEHTEGTRSARGDRPQPVVFVELGGGAALHPAESRSMGAGVPEPGADARDGAAGGPRSRREGRELRRKRRTGVPVVPGVPEADLVVPGGSLRRRRRPGGLFLVRVRYRRGAPDLLRGARSPLGRPPEVGVRPRDPVCRRRAPVPERIFPPGAVAGRVAEGALSGQRLVQHAGGDGDRGGWPPTGDRGERRRRDGQGACLAGGRRPHSPVPARQQRQGKLRALPGDHFDPLWRRSGHAHPAGDPARRRRCAGAEGPRDPAYRIPHERGALRLPHRRTDPRPDGVARTHLRAGAGGGARHRRLHHPYPRPRGERAVRSGPAAEIPRPEDPAAGDPVGGVPRPRPVRRSGFEGVRDDGVRPPVVGVRQRRGETPRRDLPGDVEGSVAGAPRGGGADPRDHQRDPQPLLAQPRDRRAVHAVLRAAVPREARGPRRLGAGGGDPPRRALADPPVPQGAARLLRPQAVEKPASPPGRRIGAAAGGGGGAEPRSADDRLLPAGSPPTSGPTCSSGSPIG